ncbi:hypothetical protein DASB73_032030 [Starmerella bacillaris]|uniref:Apple domain-containing protein n=1 Tax=Starmerella bacillaris TaxID=1247836 RepID=A0AAV5RL18_STABA|nr:hypothetical protein DASB73_032030 [Starmerella bacillaris]
MRRGTRKLLALLLVIVSGVYFLAHTGRVQAPSFIDTEKTQKYAAQFVSPKAFSSSEDSRLGNKAFVTIVTNTGDMEKRLSVHIARTFGWFPNNAVYSDEDAVVLGYPVTNIMRYLPEESFSLPGLKNFLVRHRAISEQWSWEGVPIIVDAENANESYNHFKIIPALAHSWVTDKYRNWYVLLTDETFILPATLATIVEGKDPEEVHYLGRTHRDSEYAFGGAGIVLSRGAMKKLFGDTNLEANNAIKESVKVAAETDNGDKVLYEMLKKAAGTTIGRELQSNVYTGIFQGTSVNKFFSSFDHWCETVGTFYKSDPLEYDMLADWYNSLKSEKGSNYRPTYYDFYERFTMPLVAIERPDWILETDNEADTHFISFEESSEKDCINECRSLTNCYQWSFTENKGCTLFKNVLSRGKAYNDHWEGYQPEHASICGYMYDRIDIGRKEGKYSCDNPESEEGTLVRQLSFGRFPLDLQDFDGSTYDNVFNMDM